MPATKVRYADRLEADGVRMVLGRSGWVIANAGRPATCA